MTLSADESRRRQGRRVGAPQPFLNPVVEPRDHCEGGVQGLARRDDGETTGDAARHADWRFCSWLFVAG